MNLIEECSALTTGAIKQDLRRCRMMEADIKGVFSISNGNTNLLCDYWVEYLNGEAFLVISTGLGHLPQRILLSCLELRFGSRSYLNCDCGARVNKLYLPPGKDQFRCRRCHQLRYELSTINRMSKHGRLLYRTNRTLKLVNKRAGMNRIIYNNRYTNKFERFLRLCGQAGLDGVVRDARNLMTAIKA